METSNKFQEVIKNYLDSYAKESKEFNVKYQNEEKSIEKCCDFICGEVYKMGVKGLTDDEVFYLARHYYEEDGLEINSVGCKVVVNQEIKLTDEEIKKAKEEVVLEIKNQEKRKIEMEQKAKANKQQALLNKEKKEQEAKGQLSIFDL